MLAIFFSLLLPGHWEARSVKSVEWFMDAGAHPLELRNAYCSRSPADNVVIRHGRLAWPGVTHSVRPVVEADRHFLGGRERVERAPLRRAE